MPFKRLALWQACSLALLSACAAHAQRIDARIIDVPVARLHSATDTTRMHAYYDMVKAANAGRGRAARATNFLALSAQQQEDLAVALIGLLERENAIIATAPARSLSEVYLGGYYVDLFVTVARMGDPRALRALLPVIENGDVVTQAIVGFGEPAVEHVIPLLRSADPLEASGAARTVGLMAARSAQLGLSSASMTSIRSALLEATRHAGSFIIRLNAIEGLTSFDGDDIRAEMQRIAATDTVAISKSPGKARQFVVRDAANAWLAKHSRP